MELNQLPANSSCRRGISSSYPNRTALLRNPVHPNKSIWEKQSNRSLPTGFCIRRQSIFRKIVPSISWKSQLVLLSLCPSDNQSPRIFPLRMQLAYTHPRSIVQPVADPLAVDLPPPPLEPGAWQLARFAFAVGHHVEAVINQSGKQLGTVPRASAHK